MKTTGQTMAYWRRDRGMSRLDLAEASGVSTSSIAAYEADAGMPNLNNAIALANALELSLDVYIGRRTKTCDLDIEELLTELRHRLEGGAQ